MGAMFEQQDCSSTLGHWGPLHIKESGESAYPGQTLSQVFPSNASDLAVFFSALHHQGKVVLPSHESGAAEEDGDVEFSTSSSSSSSSGGSSSGGSGGGEGVGGRCRGGGGGRGSGICGASPSSSSSSPSASSPSSSSSSPSPKRKIVNLSGVPLDPSVVSDVCQKLRQNGARLVLLVNQESGGSPTAHVLANIGAWDKSKPYSARSHEHSVAKACASAR